MWRMFASIYLYLSLILSNGVTRHVVEYDKLQFQTDIICSAYVKMFCKIVFIFSADFLKWCQMPCCWVRWTQISPRNRLKCCMWSIFANIYLYLHLSLSNGVKRDIVEYDEFRFQLEIICNVVCEECLQISNYIYPLFYQMVSHDMLLCMINSDFSDKSFEMLYVKNICKYLFIFTLKSLKWCHPICCCVW